MAYSQVVNIEVSKAVSLTTRCCVSAVINHKNITADVEAGVDHDRAAGAALESLQQPVEPRMAVGIHRLDTLETTTTCGRAMLSLPCR